MLPKNPQEVITKSLGSMMKLNADAAEAFNLVKAGINLDPFAVVDALIALLSEDEMTPSITVLQARNEILGELRKAR